MKAKMFHIGDVLSITTGRLVSPRGIQGVYDILNHMTGDEIYTHVIPRAIEVCRPVLISDHPWLNEMGNELIQAIESHDSGDNDLKPVFNTKLLEFIHKIGCSDINIMPLSPGQWLEVDPVKELECMIGENKVITIQAGES